MNFQLVVVFLVGLAASTYALDLSHAHKRSLEVEPRLLNFINDLYAQVIYPPLNHVVTNLALLGAQFLAGVSQTGIPAPGGRSLQLSDAQLRNFWHDFWNNAIKPPIENALTGASLLAAQVLAGIATNGVNLGKRDLTEAEMRNFLDDLLLSLQNIIQKPLEQALSGAALLAAQALAGLGTNGVNLSGLLGKRDLTEAEMRNFLDDLLLSLQNIIQKPLEQALSGAALLAAQALAGLGTNGVNLSGLLGKRDLTEAEMRGFLEDLVASLNHVFTNVIQKPLEDALSGAALLAAQALAGLGTNGVNLSGLLGKRDLTEAEMRGFLEDLVASLNHVFANVIQKPLEEALSGAALLAAQALAGLGTNGVNLSGLIGKRDVTTDARGAIFDNLVAQASGIYANQIKPIIENALSATALHLAGVLANFSQNGLGRR